MFHFFLIIGNLSSVKMYRQGDNKEFVVPQWHSVNMFCVLLESDDASYSVRFPVVHVIDWVRLTGGLNAVD